MAPTHETSGSTKSTCSTTSYVSLKLRVPKGSLGRIAKVAKKSNHDLRYRENTLKIRRDALHRWLQHEESDIREVRATTSRKPVKVRALLLTWNKNDLHDPRREPKSQEEITNCACDFCSEITDLGRLFEGRLGYDVERAFIPADDAEDWMRTKIRTFFTPPLPVNENPTFDILYYGGHGGVGNSRFVMSSHGVDGGTSCEWSVVDEAFRETIAGDALIIMDSCHAGAAAAGSKWLRVSNDQKYPDVMTIRQSTRRSIGLLAAGDWQSTSNVAGWCTLTSRLGRAINTLVRHKRPLTITNLSALLATGLQENIQPDLDSQVSFYPLTFVRPDFALPINSKRAFQEQHQRAYTLLASGGNMKAYSVSDGEVYVLVLRSGRQRKAGLCCGEMSFECTHGTPMKNILYSWWVESCALKEVTLERFGLKVWESEFRPDQTVGEALKVKSEAFDAAMKEAKDGLLILSVYDRQSQLGQIEDSECFCRDERTQCEHTGSRRTPGTLLKAENNPDTESLLKKLTKITPFSRYLEPMLRSTHLGGEGQAENKESRLEELIRAPVRWCSQRLRILR